MLSLFFSYILLLIVLSGIGGVFNFFLGQSSSNISMRLVFGIFSSAIFFTIFSFFLPLTIYVEIAFIVIGFFSFIYFKHDQEFWGFIKNNWRPFIPIFFICLLFSSFFPFILDYFGYYIPTIKWISEFGLIKGIANLDLLLGQMSIWHIFQAGFSHVLDPFLRMNGLILIIYSLFIFEKKSWIHLCFLPVLLLFSMSPSPDLPVIAFSLIILEEVFSGKKQPSLFFALSVFVFALKPTMIWLPIFVFLHHIFIIKTNFKFLILGSLILMLFFFKNIWTFGYPVFPVQALDFGFSWKPNPALLQISSHTAVEKTFDMQYSYSEIMKFSTIDAIKNWLFLSGMKGNIHLLLIFSLLVFLIYCIKKNLKALWFIFIAIFIKTILVLIFSAQYRFFIEVFFVIFYLLFRNVFSKKINFTFFYVGTFFFLIFMSFPKLVQKNIPSFKLGSYMLGFSKNQLLKPSYFELNMYEAYHIGNLKFNVVKGYPFSFDTPLPAISPEFLQEDLDAKIFPQWKGKTVKEGFIWKKISEKDSEKLQEILKDFNKK